MGPFEFNPAQRRLAVALGFSALLHAWLMESHYGKGMARRHAGDASIAARILPTAAPASFALPDQTMPGLDERLDERRAPVLRAAASAPVSNLPQIAIATTGATQTRTSTGADTAQLQPSDPTYYAVGDLDVFPKALVKLDLNEALAANHPSAAAGTVRATVLIDEAGVVNAVRAVRAVQGVGGAASDIETAARELLLRTRFTPARNKDGRIVKAQVLVALDFDTRAAPHSR